MSFHIRTLIVIFLHFTCLIYKKIIYKKLNFLIPFQFFFPISFTFCSLTFLFIIYTHNPFSNCSIEHPFSSIYIPSLIGKSQFLFSHHLNPFVLANKLSERDLGIVASTISLQMHGNAPNIKTSISTKETILQNGPSQPRFMSPHGQLYTCTDPTYNNLLQSVTVQLKIRSHKLIHPFVP